MIELVLVITCVAILAVIALPRFINLTQKATDISMQDLSRSFSTAINLARVQWMASAKPLNITMNGYQVGMTPQTGYPECVACNSGSLDGHLTTPECAQLWNTLMQNAPLAAIASSCGSNPQCKIAVDGSQSKPEYCMYTDRDQAGTNKIYYYYETGFVVLNPKS